jgi:hypothetical protein
MRKRFSHDESVNMIKYGAVSKETDHSGRALNVSGWMTTILTAAMSALMYGAPWN